MPHTRSHTRSTQLVPADPPMLTSMPQDVGIRVLAYTATDELLRVSKFEEWNVKLENFLDFGVN